MAENRTPDSAHLAAQVPADALASAEARQMISAYHATRKRAARPTDGTSKITAEYMLSEYQKAYRQQHPEKALRWRVNSASRLLVKLGAVITWPNGDPLEEDKPTTGTRITDTTREAATADAWGEA